MNTANHTQNILYVNLLNLENCFKQLGLMVSVSQPIYQRSIFKAESML